MSLRFKIIPEKKLVYVMGENKITNEDIFQTLDAMVNDPRYIPSMKQLIDLRRSDIIDASNEMLDKLLSIKRKFIEKFKGEVSAVIVNNDLDFGVSRMFSAQQKMLGLEMYVTRRFDCAIKALGIEINDNDLAFD